MKPKQYFYPNQVNPHFRVEVREDGNAFDPERLRCSARIARVWALVKSVSKEIQPFISANLDTDRQPIVKSFLQRANPEQVSSINKVQAEAVFGLTVYVMVDLDGRKHKALVDTGSNVKFLSEKAYLQHEQSSKLRPFREQIPPATNDPFEILVVFTGEITFDTGIKVKADLLVTLNTDVPLILGTQVM